jgi:hypothetical protein
VTLARWLALSAIGLFVAVACVAHLPTPVVTPTPLLPTIAIPLPVTPTPSVTPTVLRIVTPTVRLVSPPTPRPRQFDETDARTLLSVLFPDLKLTPDGDVFRVNDDPLWTMWLTSRVEGCFTQDETTELAAIVTNDAPPAIASTTRGSFLAIFQRRENQIHVVQRAFLFPLALVPPAFDVHIERATDFDHDGRNELLITTQSETMGIATVAAFLYWWNDQIFAPIWSVVLAEDNTAALNQPEYFATEASIRFSDVDGDAWDDIVVEGTRIDYARDAQGLADTDRETRRRDYRHVYRWNGVAFVLDPARATLLPP